MQGNYTLLHPADTGFLCDKAAVTCAMFRDVKWHLVCILFKT